MAVKSLPADKPKIVFHVAMMALQNFGFFVMYFSLWLSTPAGSVQEGAMCEERDGGSRPRKHGKS